MIISSCSCKMKKIDHRETVFSAPDNCTVYVGLMHSAEELPPAWMKQKLMLLDGISIWERPVDNLFGESHPNGKAKSSGSLKHDYIAIELRSLTKQMFSFHIVEKMDKMVESPVLNCEYVKMSSFEGPIEGHTCRFFSDLKGSRVRVQDLISILEQEGHTYDVGSKNCWHYAHATTQMVLELCENAANLSNDDRRSIMRDRQDLKKVERVLPSMLAGLFSILSILGFVVILL